MMRIYTNEDDGMESRVIERADGRFTVQLWDMDADALIGTRIVATDAQACTIARQWAGLDYKPGSIVSIMV